MPMFAFERVHSLFFREHGLPCRVGSFMIPDPGKGAAWVAPLAAPWVAPYAAPLSRAQGDPCVAPVGAALGCTTSPPPLPPPPLPTPPFGSKHRFTSVRSFPC